MADVSTAPSHTLQAAESRTVAITVVTSTFLGLAWLAVLLRLWVRSLIIRSIGWDDWAMLGTNLVYTAYCIVVLLANTYNPRLMLLDTSLAVIVEAFNYFIAGFALYIATTVVFKVALGLFYLRIMTKPWQRWVIYITVGVSTVYGTMFFFLSIFQCGPPSTYLLRAYEHKCQSHSVTLGINITAGLVNALADWILALLPIFSLRKANMPLVAKISAGALMLMGATGSICSVVRLAFLQGLTPGDNFFWNFVTLTLWSIVECGLCITAASMATLRPLFRCCMENARHFTTGGTFGSSKYKGTSSDGNSTWRSAEPRESVLSDEAAQDKMRGLTSFDLDDLELRDPRTVTTVIGNARVMEKMGVTHESIRKASLRRAESQKTLHMVSRLDPMAVPSEHV